MAILFHTVYIYTSDMLSMCKACLIINNMGSIMEYNSGHFVLTSRKQKQTMNKYV